MLKKLEHINSEIVFSNNWWQYAKDIYLMPNGEKGEYHYVHSKGSTFVIPKTEDNYYIMIKQYRYLNRKFSIEFPGGGLKEGRKPILNALDEMKEEAGYVSDKVSELGTFNPFNGVTDEICYVFLAEDCKFIGNKPDLSEEFEILKFTENEIIDFIKKGEIWDGMTLAAWSLYYFKK
ncbi:MAG: NUDIX hydrolase [Candidatus Kapabacteria bacterium]|nr:NUDIX hydrolase [Candidatus Kapabacteria bacterium]